MFAEASSDHDDPAVDVGSAFEELVDNLSRYPKRFFNSQILREDHNYDSAVAIVGPNRRQVASRPRASPAKRLDLQKFVANLDIPGLLTEAAALAPVVQGDEFLGDVPDRVVEG